MRIDIEEEFKQTIEYLDALDNWTRCQNIKRCPSCEEYYEPPDYRDRELKEYPDCYMCRASFTQAEINAGEDNRIGEVE